MANHPPEEKKTSRRRKDLYGAGDQRTRPEGNKESDMVAKTVLLINEEGKQCWLEKKTMDPYGKRMGKFLLPKSKLA